MLVPLHQPGADRGWSNPMVAGYEEGCALACSVVRGASALDKLGRVKKWEIEERFSVLFFFSSLRTLQVSLLEWKFSI